MQGKVVLVTGGAKRVGASICRRLHADGARMLIHYRRSRSEADALMSELNHVRSDSARLLQADLHEVASLPTLVERAIEQFGRLDVLVNNASSFYPTALGAIGEDDWAELLGTNLKAPLFLSQAAAGELRRTRGCIVNMADIHAERPMKGHLVYSLAKAGLVALTKGLAQELGPEVRVNAVAPGPVLWPEQNPTFDEAERRRIIEHTLLKRPGEPDDIARAVRYLVSEAPYVTGHVLAVDGGRSASL